MPNGNEDLQGFRAHAREEQARVDRLLGSRRRLHLFADPAAARRAEVQWTADITDPEFQKNLRLFRHLIAGAIGVCERRHRDEDSHVGTELENLRFLVTLPRDIPLTLKVLLGRRFELERKLVEIGDEEYLRSRAADLYDEGEGTAWTWRRLFDEPPPLLVDAIGRADLAPNGSGGREANPVKRTQRMLARLLAVKEAQDLPLRARRELKQQALLVVLPALTLVTILFAAAIAIVDGFRDGAFLLGAAAGAAGAALGGLINLRDEVNLGAQIREFVPFFVGELAVGATAGLLAFVTVRSGIVRVGEGETGIAALGFAVGFSEAALLGLVGRIAETVSGSRQKEKNAAGVPGESSPRE
jgi:hypothetical protein